MRTGHNGVVFAGVHPVYAIIGPAPCQGCGTLVWFARSQTRVAGQIIPGSLLWRERTGRVHRCINGKRDGRSQPHDAAHPQAVA